MKERDLAERIMQDRGQIYVDKSDGITLGALQLADFHQEHCFKIGKSIFATDVECQAIKHWVECAGYRNDGKFVYMLTKRIHNC